MVPIHYAVKYGNLQVVQWLWATQNESLNHFHKRQWNPLHFACWSGHANIVEFLLNNGIDPNSKSENKETPMMLSCFLGYDDSVRILLEHGANVQGDEKKPLYWASKGGHLSTVKILVESGANVDDTEQTNILCGETPLMIAARYGFLDIVDYLIRNGADKNKTNAEGILILYFFNQNALQLAQENHQQNVIDFLSVINEESNQKEKVHRHKHKHKHKHSKKK